MGALTIICIIFIIICSYLLNIEREELSKITKINPIIINTLKDLLVVIASILGTNLLINGIIEVKSKNQLLTDIIANDIIASPNFYTYMDTVNQLKMCQALEKNLFFQNNTIKQDMSTEVRQKILDIKDPYYFEECDFIVTSTIYDKYIEEDVTKKIVIKSYGDSCHIENYPISNYSSKTTDVFVPFELLSVNINGKEINIENDIKQITSCKNSFDEQNKFNSNIRYVYNKKILINNKDGVNIILKYKTRTTIDDRLTVFRVGKPCKRFSLIYNLTPDEKYRLAINAFGFFDDGSATINDDSNYHTNIEFSNWIFTYDGVVIMILDA